MQSSRLLWIIDESASSINSAASYTWLFQGAPAAAAFPARNATTKSNPALHLLHFNSSRVLCFLIKRLYRSLRNAGNLNSSCRAFAKFVRNGAYHAEKAHFTGYAAENHFLGNPGERKTPLTGREKKKKKNENERVEKLVKLEENGVTSFLALILFPPPLEGVNVIDTFEEREPLYLHPVSRKSPIIRDFSTGVMQIEKVGANWFFGRDESKD